jgi:putative addiction module component (TIGR02574 family)
MLAMTSSELEEAALHLPAQERARLVQRLLESLDQLPEEEARQLWLVEAQRRADEIDQGEVQLMDGDELEQQIQALLR